MSADASTIKFPPTPSHELIASNPDVAARAWQERAEQVVLAQNRKEYGAEIARLMELPFDQAWGPLTKLAEDGDIRAAAAAALIVSVCRKPDSPPGNFRLAPPPASNFYPDLSPEWKSFVDHLDSNQKEIREQRTSHCDGVGNTFDFMLMMLDQFMRPENADAQIEIAADNTDASQAIADLQRLAAEHPGPRVELLLGERLLQSPDATQNNEGRKRLERAAQDDPAAADRLGQCLAEGCGTFPPDPSAAREWLERAAGLGDQLGFSDLKKLLDATSDRADAWAWSLYTLDLFTDGCLEMFVPTYAFVAFAAEDEARRKAALSPAEQNAGLAIYYGIGGRWEQKARERLSCAD